MPSVIDTDETLTEILELPTYKVPQQTAALCHDESTEELRKSQDAWEKSIDILVRKNPYIYVDALLS